MEAQRRILRPRDGVMLGGVCAALARAYGLDATLVRAAFALLGLFGVGLLAYLLCWGLLPREDAI